MQRIYNNKPYELLDNLDLFGTAEKAETIKNMLEDNMDFFKENNMIALYGDWGSGKTSVMKYIMSSVKNYNVVFFEAWKYEKDTNLALSLFEAIIDEIERKYGPLDQLIEDVKLVGKTLLSFSKNLLLNTRVSFLGINWGLGQAGKDTIKEMEDEIKKHSYYTEVKEFNELYKKVLDKYYEKTNKKLLVFIDDLDRCEPNHILDLLSSIKHFFIESENIVYFCGVDKVAVNNAINIKYQNKIKSEEYLEKIFDITFNMPGTKSLDNLVNDFYSKITVYGSTPTLSPDGLCEFLERINFTNPRKIKKVFNRYIFLCNMASTSPGNAFSLLPLDLLKHTSVQMTFTLFITIIYEFYKEIFNEIYDYESKFAKLAKVHFKNSEQIIHKKSNHSEPIGLFLSREVRKIPYLTIDGSLFHKLLPMERENDLMNFLFWMIPTDINEVNLPLLSSQNADDLEENLTIYINQYRVTENKIIYLFLDFILEKYFKCPDFFEGCEFKLFQGLKMANLYF
ncbi:KAP family P-loop NTPase fold protein [Neobacillus sp. 19]|uniref:KAP family P-loop NTPase fold protein n=1 Tax=Neobacillus sp. 19 TaxID=3394458 RepID=UPI003BF6B1D9